MEIRDIHSKKKEPLNFSGHGTFPFRCSWLKKAVEAVTADPKVFSEKDAFVKLGVGKNMVDSIKHWGKLLGILDETVVPETRARKLHVSSFGEKLFSDNGWDPYLEDVGTLWLLHWKICTQRYKACAWFFAFSKFAHIEFNKAQLAADVKLFAQTADYKKSLAVIERDIYCLLRAYAPAKIVQGNTLEDSLDCPLIELGLIRNIGGGTYLFAKGAQKELPDALFLLALNDYWHSFHADKQSVSIEDIAYGEGSPGLIFKLTEDALVQRLENLEKISKGAFSYDETSGLRQVYRENSAPRIEPESLLNQYYSGAL